MKYHLFLCGCLIAVLSGCDSPGRLDGLTEQEIFRRNVHFEVDSVVDKANEKIARLEWRIEQLERKLEGKPAEKSATNAFLPYYWIAPSGKVFAR